MPEYKYTDDELKKLIDQYCTDFTAHAKEGLYDPIHGRDAEIEQVMLILMQKGRKNAMIQAPAGVGKTALCVGLAQKIVSGNIPSYLKDARVIEIDLAAMAAGTDSLAEFQGRVVPLLKAAAERYHDTAYHKHIFFIDEIHQVMPSCVGSAYAGLSEVLKPYLTAGTLNMIGATTKDEYRTYIEADPAMDRRFQKVNLAIPDAQATIHILHAIRSRYEAHHKIDIPDTTIQLIVALTEEHMRKRHQPDKSIITMDAACAYHVLKNGTDQPLSEDSVYTMVSKDTGLHKAALMPDG